MLEEIDIPEGTEVLVTPLIGETDFWSKVSRPALDAIWDNAEDDVYSDLESEGFIGMWRDRDDMKDSAAWVRGARQSE